MADPPKLPQGLLDIFLATKGLFSESEGSPVSPDTLGSVLGPPGWALPPPPIQQKWYYNQVVYIDGYTFEGCRFDRCTLVVAWATFSFRRCYIDPNCVVYFTEPALKIARLVTHALKLHGHLPALQWTEAKEIFPTINEDDTFTLE